MLKSSRQSIILNGLPDDRPITAIQVVENIAKCPKGFYPISRTYDQDQDADLKEISFFKIASSRYLCLSKSEGLPNFVISELLVVNEKIIPPGGFSLLNRTADSEQKAWKKKQLCYRLSNLKDTKLAVTDIIVCGRLKKAPDGFLFAGDLNGLTICYKMGNVQDHEKQSGNPNSQAPARPPRPAPPPPVSYPNLNADDHDYEILSMPNYPPVPRMGPQPPVPTNNQPARQNSTQNTMNSNYYSAIEGVPFIINPKFMNSAESGKVQLPLIKAKTMQQLLKEYSYPFTVERQS